MDIVNAEILHRQTMFHAEENRRKEEDLVTEAIIMASLRGEFAARVNIWLSDSLKSELESLGYKLSKWSDRGSDYTMIGW